jgi:dihydrofolate reductase
MGGGGAEAHLQPHAGEQRLEQCPPAPGAGAILDLKQQPGGDLLIFGSPGLAHAFLALDAIDEFWINLNPVLLGQGVRYLDDAVKTKLTLTASRVFDNGVIRLNYVKGN